MSLARRGSSAAVVIGPSVVVAPKVNAVGVAGRSLLGWLVGCCWGHPRVFSGGFNAGVVGDDSRRSTKYFVD